MPGPVCRGNPSKILRSLCHRSIDIRFLGGNSDIFESIDFYTQLSEIKDIGNQLNCHGSVDNRYMIHGVRQYVDLVISYVYLIDYVSGKLVINNYLKIKWP